MAKRVVAALALLALGVAAAPARADLARSPAAEPSSSAPMRFVRVRSGGACAPDCPEWISAEGRIVIGSADALARVLEALGDRRLPILINSGGGSVVDAMAMGRLIRDKRLAVVVAHTEVAPCAANAKDCGVATGVAKAFGAYCASACTLVLAGGAERYVSPLAFVGVHQLTELVTTVKVRRSYAVRYLRLAGFKFELSRRLTGEHRSRQTTKRVADRKVDAAVRSYLDDMGVREPAMALMLKTPAKTVRWLTDGELAASRLATIWLDGDSPIVEGPGAGGLGGLPVDAHSGAAALLEASADYPLAGRPERLAASFAYRRGGGAVSAAFLVRQAPGGAPVAPSPTTVAVVLRSEGAELRAAPAAAGEPMRMTIPLGRFCRLRRGAALVGFVASPPAASADAAALASAPPVAIDAAAADGATALFDEACPVTASR